MLDADHYRTAHRIAIKERIVRKALLIGVLALLLVSPSIREDKMESSFAVHLNHFYVILDSATYKAIEADEFIRSRFVVAEQRTTVRTDRTYTGLYLYGANTYFEFFDASQKTMGGAGASGIAFGVDQPGTLQSLVKELPSEFTLQPVPITRQYNDSQVPWFFMAVPKTLRPDSGFSLWIMEYHSRFLAEWKPAGNKQEQGISRRHILARYAAVLKKTPTQPYLQDVIGLTICLDKSTAVKLVELCRLLGYRSSTEGNATSLEGPDIKMRVVAEADSARGIREITMRVKGGPEKQTEYHFGKAVLRFVGNGQATWSF